MKKTPEKKSKLEKTAGGKVKKIKDANAPKRFLTAYMQFCLDTRQSLRDSNPEVSFSAMAQQLGELWKALDEGKKKVYIYFIFLFIFMFIV